MNQVDAGGAAPPGWYTNEGRAQWWDGATWADGPPQVVPAAFLPLHGLARATQAALFLTCLTVAVAIHSLVGRLDMIDRLDRSDATLTLSEVERSDRYVVDVEYAQIGLMALTGVLFLVWLWRVYRNLHRTLGARNLDVSPGWAVGWWFVPVANLVKPVGIMSEAWAASHAGYLPNSDHWKHGRRSPLVGFWWPLFIGASFVPRYLGSADVAATGFEALDLAALRLSAWAHIGSKVLLIGAGVLLVVIVGQITDRQDQRRVELQAGG